MPGDHDDAHPSFATVAASPPSDRPRLAPRPWLPPAAAERVAELTGALVGMDADAIDDRLAADVHGARERYARNAISLDPAANVMNPKAEALLASGLGSRPSLGPPGAKIETGVEPLDAIEATAAELAARLFDASFAEVRVLSGAMANLATFLALAKPGDRIVVPPAAIGGHVTHHAAGAAGRIGLEVHPAPIDADGFTVDVDGVRELAQRIRPRLITLGGSLNLAPHPVAEVRAVADEVGATLMFDAAHLSGPIAGAAWPNPLRDGAQVMTMSTYKSLGGPPGGLVLTNDPVVAQRVEEAVFPGLTANFDAARVAALAVALLDALVHGRAYAEAMVATARALGDALRERGLPVVVTRHGVTTSHQLALDARRWGGGGAAARRAARAGLLACGIGLPLPEAVRDVNGLRLGVNEIVRRGMGPDGIPELADLLARALHGHEAPETVAPDVTALRRRFDGLRFVRS
ncbi:MAG: aminotransferase class I/II-fold pyridoxal phosphate-dependent enzyme [Trueperaceae bacterium]